MAPHAPDTPASGPLAVADALLDTLRQEAAALDALQAHFGQQLDALRTHDTDRIEQATEQTHTFMGRLDQLRQTRERHMRLLARIVQAAPSASLEELAAAVPALPGGDAVRTALLEARAVVRHQAALAQKRCTELEFALQYAVQLSRDLLMAVQGLDVPPPAGVYTASGASAPTTPRSLLNRIG